MKHIIGSEMAALAASAVIERKGGEDDTAGIVTKALEGFQQVFDSRIKDVERKAADSEKVVARLDQIEAKINRRGGGVMSDDASEIEKKAFNTFMRHGGGPLDDTEKKALNIGSPGAGGYITAPEYSTRIIERVLEISPMRQLGGVMTIGGEDIYLPKLGKDVEASWVTETGKRSESEPTFEQQKISVFEQAVVVPVSTRLLEDSFIDLQSYLEGLIARKFAKGEAVAFVNGDGNGKPKGFLADAALMQAVPTAKDGSDILASLINLYYALPTEYAKTAVWTMNRKTMAKIRSLVDGDKRMIWGDSIADGQPATLLGRPISEMVDMPDVGAGTIPVAFGDFATGYQIVDRTGIQIMRDDYTGADNGIVKIRARRRVGGALVQGEAIAVLKAAA